MKDGKILTGDLTIVNQLLPHKNKWAYELFLKGQKNNWVPTEVGMAKDIEQWKDKFLSEDERMIIKRCLGFFAGSESLVANNLLLSVFKYVSDAECRQFILWQGYNESIHNQTVVYICDSLDLNIKEVYEAYQSIPSIKAKDEFLMDITKDINRDGFRVFPYPKQGEPSFGEFSINSINWDKAISSRQEVLRNLITYYIICEGILFYAGFVMLLSFGRQNKMPGIAEQVQYSYRDEAVHVEFGIKLINTIIQQEPEIWTEEFKNETYNHIIKAVNLEIDYAKDIMPRGVMGLNSENFVDYLYFIGNDRANSVGLGNVFPETRNPFPWMTETIELTKQKNFFETRVTDYQSGMVDDFGD